MITLYDNPFSPFARKVRMVLFWKNLPFESVDGLELSTLDALGAVNPRREVPVLVDGEARVVNSADIVAYLDHRHGPPLALPAEPLRRVEARAWERLADGVVDAILHDVSIWAWPTHHRPDAPPPGLLEAGQRDLRTLFDMLERGLGERDFLCGDVSVADIALFPHLQSTKVLGLAPERPIHPRLCAWLERMRTLPFVRRDLDVVRRGVAEKFRGGEPPPYESERVVWRGDRLEWLFVSGFHDWWAGELRAGRAIVPRSL
jgi:glutathione S-transferase